MTNHIITFAAAAALLAGPASAQSITVSLVGKDPVAARAEIRKAAQNVCARSFDSTFSAFYGQPVCVREAVRRAEAQLQAFYASREAAAKLASAR